MVIPIMPARPFLGKQSALVKEHVTYHDTHYYHLSTMHLGYLASVAANLLQVSELGNHKVPLWPEAAWNFYFVLSKSHKLVAKQLPPCAPIACQFCNHQEDHDLVPLTGQLLLLPPHRASQRLVK